MKKGKKRTVPTVEEVDLGRFAGSSDEEEEEEEPMAPPATETPVVDSHLDADEENSTDEGEEDDDDDGDTFPPDEYGGNDKAANAADDDDDSSSVEGEDMDPAKKMANVMSRILESTATHPKKKTTQASSVVLGKTVTPLQKLQQKEKEQLKAMKEKRKANRERNLTALHMPLSIATTNTIQPGGQLSVAKELEQERFHRRVATRGVVALFNAITQHQRTTNTDNDSSVLSKKNQETSKITKHGFLDKIKEAAKSKGDEQNTSETSKSGKADGEGNNRSSWSALKDDYMLNPKKNWDEESSEDEANEDSDSGEGDAEVGKKVPASRKKRRVSGKQ
jgi:hypothetical protein